MLPRVGWWGDARLRVAQFLANLWQELLPGDCATNGGCLYPGLGSLLGQGAGGAHDRLALPDEAPFRANQQTIGSGDGRQPCGGGRLKVCY